MGRDESEIERMPEKKLNKAQKEAVTYTDGPLLIVAGAGTGKTTVITEKIAYLIKTKKVAPSHILALAFNEKTAAEMQERADLFLNDGYLDIEISTFHAFCRRILEQYGLEIGLPNQFRTLQDTDAWLFAKSHIYDFNLLYYRPLGNPTRHIHELLKHFSKCKDELISPEEYLAYAEQLALDSDDVHTDDRSRLTELANAYHTYNQLLLDNLSLDLGDLIFYAVTLLKERPRIRRILRQRFTHILVDEFQDVNYAQYELIKLLSTDDEEKKMGMAELTNQLTVVGDDDQSIYAFRGASVANILRFKEDYAGAKEVVLTENYRSAQIILDLAYRLIQENNPDRLEQKLHIDKKLIAKGEKQKGEVLHLHFSSLEDEVHAVVKKILDIREKESASWDDIAILVRANNHAEPFMAGLEAAGIPYEYLTSSGLFRQSVVTDCAHFFSVVNNRHDSGSLYRLLQLPFLALGEDDLDRIMHAGKKKTIAYYDILEHPASFQLSAEGIAIAEKMMRWIKEGARRARYEKPTSVLLVFLEESGYLRFLREEEEKGNPNAGRSIHYLKQFFECIGAYERAVPDARVFGFVEYFGNMVLSGDEGKLYQPSDTPDSVNMMTVHGAKGLEYRFVFIVNCVEERFPTKRHGDAIELPIPLIKERLPEGDYHYQEERRLCYVAMTRAKERLYFTSADMYNGVRKKKISRFLHEIGLEADDAAGNAHIFAHVNAESTKKTLAPKRRYELPKVFSFSQIRSFDTCPYQYKIMHILKIPMKGTAAFSFGNTMHNTLHRFYQRVQEGNGAIQTSLFASAHAADESGIPRVPDLQELLEDYEKAWISDWYWSKEQREEYYKKGKEILHVFYKENEGAWTVPIALESGFKIKIGSYLISGKIDRVDQLDNKTLHIIDYKTGKSKETLSSEDKQQLLLYQKAAEILPEYRNVGPVGSLTYYYLNDNTKQSFKGTAKEMEKFEKKIIEILDELHATDFHSITREEGCGRCEVCLSHI